MQAIAEPEVHFFPGGDHEARLFRWHGGLYRRVTGSRADLYRRLLEGGSLNDLMSDVLIKTSISALRKYEGDLVLAHDLVGPLSYCVEWGAAMWRDAALAICDLSLALHERGLGLRDVHAWNVVFDGTRPVFVDFAAIWDDANGWPTKDFIRWNVLPLLLISGELARIARPSLLAAHDRSALSVPDVLRAVFVRRPSLTTLAMLPAIVRTAGLARSFDDSRQAILAARAVVESVPVGATKSEWTNYLKAGERLDLSDPKTKTVVAVLDRLKPSTVLDIGCNQGLFSELAAGVGARVVAADVDEASVNALYERTKLSGLPIHPVVLDIMTPTPAHGVANAFLPAVDRFRSDLVLCLAVTHHLVFKRGATFPGMAAQLAQFTAKALLVEFVPRDDIYVREWIRPDHGWYQLDGFVAALKEHFASVEVLESAPAPRKLLLCTKAA